MLGCLYLSADELLILESGISGILFANQAKQTNIGRLCNPSADSIEN